MKVKCFLVWSLILALMSLGIGPELAVAAKKTYDSPSLTEDAYGDEADDKETENLLIGAGIIVGVVLIGSLIWWGVSRNKTKTASSKNIEPKDKKMGSLGTESKAQEKDSKATNTHDNLFDSSGDLVVFAW